MRYFIILFLFLAGIAGLKAQISYRSFDLDNGLHVIMHRDPATPIVTIGVLYHVGSKNEDPQRTGFAHFFEHLMFEGSQHIERGGYAKMIESAGGDYNAYTTQDQTYYYEVMPSNYLERALWMESERMLHAQINEKGVETQREVVKEERRYRYENQPYGSFQEELYKRAFREHPYHWRPAGSAEYIDQARIEEFRDFYKTFYVPQNAILCVAGDLDYDQTRKWVEKYFKDIPRGSRPLPRPQVTEPPLDGEIRDTVYDNIRLPAVIMGYRIPSLKSEDFPAVEMLSTLLAGSPSARLRQSLVDQQQLATGVAAYAFPQEDPGLMIVYAVGAVGVPADRLEAALNEEISRVQEQLPHPQEFTRLQNQTEAEWVSSHASLMDIAESLAENYLYFGDPGLINTGIERYQALTPQDLQKAAQKYLVPENRVTLFYLPKPSN